MLTFALTNAFAGAAERDPAQVRVEGETAYYSGPITANGVGALPAARDDGKFPITWLEINSSGGEINRAMDLGDWVHSNGINVRVTDRCLSSCANYVFTAGQVKVIEPGAIVAWHGSAIQHERASRREITDVIERQILPATAPAERASVKTKLLEDALAYLDEAKARQAVFFEKIGVDERITTIGESHPAVRDFWFLSVESMTRYGVDFVVAPSDYIYTDTSHFGEGLVTYIDVEQAHE